MCCFFFQAEDGIRDGRVTGVQTCALPIFRELTAAGMMDCKNALEETGGDFDKAVELLRIKGAKDVGKRAERTTANGLVARSEERRVGKECRSRWSPDQEKKKTNGSRIEEM